MKKLLKDNKGKRAKSNYQNIDLLLFCTFKVQITKAERDVYAAIIDEKVAMKIGPGHYEPQSGVHRWSLATEGRDYKVWEAS